MVIGRAEELLREIKRETNKGIKLYFGFQFLIYTLVLRIFPNVTLDIHKKDLDKINRVIEDLNLEATPGKIIFVSLIMSLLSAIIIVLSILLGFSLSIFLFTLVVAMYIIYLFVYYPYFLYEKLMRLRENQMPLAIFYVISYMKLNPNLERALEFASRYLSFPLKTDFLKILWKLETKREVDIVEALNKYLMIWIDEDYHFVEAFEIIISTIYESDQYRREILFDRAINSLISGTETKMREYARNLKGPIETIYMLGLLLPLLTITLLPIVGAFMSDIFRPDLLFVTYDIFIPFFSFIIGVSYLSKRPGFSIYVDTYLNDLIEREINKTKAYSIIGSGTILFLLFLIFGTILFNLNLRYDIFALLYSLITVFILGISISVGFSIYYKRFKKYRERVVKITKDLPFMLYYLSDLLSRGYSLEICFYKVYSLFRKRELGNFAGIVYKNLITGMDIEKAIFNKENGALVYYPSSLLRSSMEVLVESQKKGSEISGKILMYMADFLGRLNEAEGRLKDLMAEVTSSMKTLINFMAPLMIGLIMGLTTMLIGILYSFSGYSKYLTSLLSGSEEISAIPLDLLYFFSIKNVIPPFSLQLIVGIYLIELVLVLSIFLSRIEVGYDVIVEKKYISEYLKNSMILYFVVAGISSLLLWQLALSIFQLII